MGFSSTGRDYGMIVPVRRGIERGVATGLDTMFLFLGNNSDTGR
jgi:hypothetical protein